MCGSGETRDFCSVHRAQVVFPWDMSAVIGKGVWEKLTGNWFAFTLYVAVSGQ